MKIGSFDTDRTVLVVAEIGNNHEGNFEAARLLVDRAAECRVDAVKFQTFRTEHYVSRSDADRFARLRSFELTPAQFEELAGRARSRGLLFLSTPFDLQSADFLATIVDAFKISSGDNTFYPLLKRVAGFGKPVIVSTGLADVGEIRRAVDTVRSGGAREVSVLHCVSSYPVPPEQANLRSIPFLASQLDVPVGYSDHTTGIEASVLAVALGARILEKHFTLDHDYSAFRDHKLSADPGEMAELVRRVREAERLLGQAAKSAQPCEQSGLLAFRRSVVAVRDLPAGHRLTPEDLTWVRPGGGMAPGDEGSLLGRQLKRALVAGDRLSPSDV